MWGKFFSTSINEGLQDPFYVRIRVKLEAIEIEKWNVKYVRFLLELSTYEKVYIFVHSVRLIKLCHLLIISFPYLWTLLSYANCTVVQLVKRDNLLSLEKRFLIIRHCMTFVKGGKERFRFDSGKWQLESEIFVGFSFFSFEYFIEN